MKGLKSRGFLALATDAAFMQDRFAVFHYITVSLHTCKLFEQTALWQHLVGKINAFASDPL